MFEHLDDPTPPQANLTVRRAVAARAAALRARRRRMVAAGVVAALVAAGTGTALALTRTGSGGSVDVAAQPPRPHRTGPTTAPAPATLAPTTTTTLPPTTTIPPVAEPTVACGELLPAETATTGPPPNGSPERAQATLEGVSATLTGRATTLRYHEFVPALAGAELRITDGASVVTRPVTAPQGAAGVMPTDLSGTTGGGYAGDPLCVARFAASAAPTVLLGLTFGAMHCCTVLRAINVPGGTFTDVTAGNPPAKVTDRPTGALVVTADDAFEYAFTDFGDSGAPIMIYEVSAGALVDTTRHHPDLIAADAAQWMTAFDQNPTNNLGDLAAWVADECLLGHATSAWATVNGYNADGRLGHQSTNWPSGTAYVDALRSFLAQHHYC
jgi:hypothetical protein